MQKDWFKYRGYPHIANKIPNSKRREVQRYVQNRRAVARHSFLPLISKHLIQRRYKRFDSYNSNIRAHYSLKDGKIVPSRKVRIIAYASHLDTHVYAYYSKMIIEPEFEKIMAQDEDLNASVIAYRAIPTPENKGNKNNIHFAKEVFDEIRRRQNCVALLFDIENFFPSLKHDLLKKQWSKVLGVKSLPKDHYNLFKAVTRYSYIRLNDLRTPTGNFDEKKLAEIRSTGKDAYFSSVKEFVNSDIPVFKNPTPGKGIPQGLPISALLANIYMLEFDSAICEKLVKEKQAFYRRYSDDMVVVCRKDQVEEVKRVVKDGIEKVEITIADEKTEEVDFRIKTVDSSPRLQSFKVINGAEVVNMPMNYLGFEFYGYQTLIKSKNLSAFYREMKQTIRRKSRRVEQRKENELVDELPLFKRKVYRLYSYQGISKRKLISNKGLESKEQRERLFRGNFIRYAHKAAKILEAPGIRHQIRNHWKILQRTIAKYEFSNGPEKPDQ